MAAGRSSSARAAPIAWANTGMRRAIHWGFATALLLGACGKDEPISDDEYDRLLATCLANETLGPSGVCAHMIDVMVEHGCTYEQIAGAMVPAGVEVGDLGTCPGKG